MEHGRASVLIPERAFLPRLVVHKLGTERSTTIYPVIAYSTQQELLYSASIAGRCLELTHTHTHTHRHISHHNLLPRDQYELLTSFHVPPSLMITENCSHWARQINIWAGKSRRQTDQQTNNDWVFLLPSSPQREIRKKCLSFKKIYFMNCICSSCALNETIQGFFDPFLYHVNTLLANSDTSVILAICFFLSIHTINNGHNVQCWCLKILQKHLALCVWSAGHWLCCSSSWVNQTTVDHKNEQKHNI